VQLVVLLVSIGVSLSTDNSLFRFAITTLTSVRVRFRAMLCVFMPTDPQASPFSASPNALEAFVYIE
jgi:hypothetical protein